MTEQKIEVHFLEQEIGIQIYALSKVVFSEVKHNKEKYMAITKHAVSIHQQGGSKVLRDGIKTTDENVEKNLYRLATVPRNNHKKTKTRIGA